MYYSAHNNQRLEHVLSQFNPNYTLTTYRMKIYFIFIISCKQFSQLVSSFHGSRPNFFMYFYSHVIVTCALLVITVGLVTLIILYERCNYGVNFTRSSPVSSIYTQIISVINLFSHVVCKTWIYVVLVSRHNHVTRRPIIYV